MSLLRDYLTALELLGRVFVAYKAKTGHSAGQSGEGRKRFFFEKKAAPARREPKNF
jgi:hypothetical protein